LAAAIEGTFVQIAQQFCDNAAVSDTQQSIKGLTDIPNSASSKPLSNTLVKALA
jgi:hypothetical protein